MTRYRAMGRLVIPDERDALYPLSSVLRTTELAERFWWDDGWHGDQGYDPHCVAFAWAHYLADGPRTRSIFVGRRPGVDTTELYCAAQEVDPWPGNCVTRLYDGTSVRAGAKVLQERGFIAQYRWTHSAEELAQAVLTVGPVIVGTTWWTGMYMTDPGGFIKPTGSPDGGHAYVVNGVNTEAGYFRIKNSWGLGWGDQGRANISMADMQALLDDHGEACIAIPSVGAP